MVSISATCVSFARPKSKIFTWLRTVTKTVCRLDVAVDDACLLRERRRGRRRAG